MRRIIMLVAVAALAAVLLAGNAGPALAIVEDIADNVDDHAEGGVRLAGSSESNEACDTLKENGVIDDGLGTFRATGAGFCGVVLPGEDTPAFNFEPGPNTI